jgi:hypothetical protein
MPRPAGRGLMCPSRPLPGLFVAGPDSIPSHGLIPSHWHATGMDSSESGPVQPGLPVAGPVLTVQVPRATASDPGRRQRPVTDGRSHAEQSESGAARPT